MNNTRSSPLASPGQDLILLTTILDYFTKYVWIPTTVLGIVGNVLSFIVSLLKDNRRYSTCVYMAGLAVVDSILLLFTVAVMYTKTFVLEEPITEYQLQWGFYVAYTTAILSGLFLTLMSIDRLVAVRFPLAAKQRCTPSKATRDIAISVVAVSALNVHVFFVFKNEAASGEGAVVLKIMVPGYPALETLVDMYHLVCGSLAPFVVIVFCNLWIIVTLRNAARGRHKMGVSQDAAKTQEKETQHLTRMLILVCLAFVVTSVPYRLYNLVVTSLYDLEDEYWALRYTTQHYILLEIWHWNYGINFFLYFIGGGRKYRADVKRLFQCKIHSTLTQG